MQACLLLLLGHPSIYSSYLKGFLTRNPKKLHEYIFNIVFWLMISVAYFSYVKLSSRFGFFITKLLYFIGIIVSFIIVFGFINPYLGEIGFFEWIGH